ncbi:MAG: L-seryl-tRNA(Sec) selenium transferase, partial [Desulfatibacillaceae bacterium]|nr:L-seryl-tRNA(Sec) selenium transferase [Desulfatibacillaceae bacterium]
DYEKAIDEETAMLMKAHTSNFAVVGFTASVSLADLCSLAKNRGLLVMEDLGSGSLMDLSCFGLAKEPTVSDSVAAGADIVTFSGDKLLGGPQAGIIVGRADCLDAIKKNPIARALRIDKLTLAALEATLRLYRDPEKAVRQIPTLAMISAPEKELAAKARSLEAKIRKKAVTGLATGRLSTGSRVGGGALPTESLKSVGVALTHESLSASGIERVLRAANPPVIGRIEQDTFIMDVRTIDKSEITLLAETIATALDSALSRGKEKLP